VNCPYCNAPNQTGQICSTCGASLILSALSAGTLLLNKYRILRPLGQGGFGIAYLAEDTVLNRQVVIKEFFPDGSVRLNNNQVMPSAAFSPAWNQFAAYFRDEAKLQAKYARYGSPEVYEVFDGVNNTVYTVMAYLPGRSLEARLEQKGAISPEECTQLALRMAGILKALHQDQIIHRDISPGNIYLVDDHVEQAYLLDFGIARAFQANVPHRFTQLANPIYAPIEQFGEEAKLGPYTDLYALGATLYHAVTGVRPRSAGDRLSGLELYAFPANLPESLEFALNSALELKFWDRIQNMGEFEETLKGNRTTKTGILVVTDKIQEIEDLSSKLKDKGQEVGDLSNKLKELEKLKKKQDESDSTSKSVRSVFFITLFYFNAFSFFMSVFFPYTTAVLAPYISFSILIVSFIGAMFFSPVLFIFMVFDLFPKYERKDKLLFHVFVLIVIMLISIWRVFSIGNIDSITGNTERFLSFTVAPFSLMVCMMMMFLMLEIYD
jgi:serine/threonine protein kinase